MPRGTRCPGAAFYTGHAAPMGKSPQRVFTKADDEAWIEGRGIVVRLLSDDGDGARHQRFVVDMRNGQTLLIAHNIDLAPRVPVGLGDSIRFRGSYEWSDLGGVVHWTHRDPMSAGEGGYVQHRDQTYR